jgi:hypothetical protein
MGKEGTLLDRIRNSRVVRKPGYRWLGGALLLGALAWGATSNTHTSMPIEEPRGGPSALESRVEGTPSQPSGPFVSNSTEEYLEPVEEVIPITVEMDPPEAAKYRWDFDLRQSKEKQPKLIEFLDKYDIGYEVVHNRIFLPESTIKQIADLMKFSADETRNYLCTEKHKSVLFDPIDKNPLLRKAIMTVESHGFGRCNVLNYCGEMQIGDKAVTEVLRILTQYSSRGTGKEFNQFREENSELLGNLTDLLDQHTEGYVSKVAQLNQDISEAKKVTNELYDKYNQLVIENQSNPENYNKFSAIRRNLGKYNRFLSAANEYFAGTVFALEQNPNSKEIRKSKSKKEVRRNKNAKSAIRKRLKELSKESTRDYSTAINLVRKQDSSLGYLTVANIADMVQTEFSPNEALNTFSSVWEKSKDNTELNVGVARVFASYLQHVASKDLYDENGEVRRGFENIDPLRYMLECYNKGHSHVHKYVVKNGKLPPAAKNKKQSYSEHVTSTLQMILDFDKTLYGDNLNCSKVKGGVECEITPALNGYISMLSKN